MPKWNSSPKALLQRLHDFDNLTFQECLKEVRELALECERLEFPLVAKLLRRGLVQAALRELGREVANL